MLAQAVFVALLQCRQNSDCQVHARARVADRRPHIGRWTIGEAGHTHRAAHGLSDRLETLEFAVRSEGAKALDGGINQSGIDLFQGLIAQTHAVQGAGRKIFH